MGEFAVIAELTKTKNLDGGLVAQSAKGLPFLLEPGMEVTFVPPQLGVPRSAKVASIRDEGTQRVVHFEGIDDIDAATIIAGCFCLVRRSDLPETLNAAGEGTFLGVEVRDAQGNVLGTVTEVEPNPAHPLLVVDDGQRVVRIPAVDEFVVDYQAPADDAKDGEAGVLVVDLPEGLLDL